MSQPSLLVVPSQIGQGKLFAYSPLVGAPVEFEVTRATSRTRVNVSGVIESIGSGIVGLDYFYNGAVQSCPAFNPQQSNTNNMLWSEDLNNAVYTKSGITITSNSVVAPDGTTTADTATATTTTPDLYQDRTAISESRVYSVFCKRGNADEGANRFLIRNQTTATNLAAATINYSTGVLTQTIGTGAFVVAWPNDWYQVVFPIVSGISIGNTIRFRIGFTTATQTSGHFAYFWGIESKGAYTSYIKTEGSTVTRNAEVISLASGSTYIGQTQGAIAGRFIAGTNAGHIAMLSDGTTNNSIQIDYGNAGAGVLRATVFTAGVPHTLVSSGALASGFHSFCFTYESGSFALYVDGALAEADTAAFLPSGLARIDIGSSLGASSWYNGRIRHLALYKEIPDNPATISTL